MDKEKDFEQELRKLLTKALASGLDVETIASIVEWTIEGNDWSPKEEPNG